MADILSFAAQATTVKAELGKDAPKALDNAKDTGELRMIVQTLIVEHTKNSDRMEIDITTIQGQQKARMDQMLQIMRGSAGKYPVDRVPQLQLPTMP
jgi:hypothetical protein